MKEFSQRKTERQVKGSDGEGGHVKEEEDEGDETERGEDDQGRRQMTILCILRFLPRASAGHIDQILEIDYCFTKASVKYRARV